MIASLRAVFAAAGREPWGTPRYAEPAKTKPRRIGIWQRLPTFNVGDMVTVSGIYFRVVEADGDMRRLEPVPPR